MPADRTADSTSQTTDAAASRSKTNKKFRTPGACDLCKRRKVKCDSANMPSNRCTNCVVAGVECTHDEVLKNLRTMREYVEVLEERLKHMDELLNKAMPGINTSTLVKETSKDDAGGKEQAPIPRNDDEIENLNTKIKNLRLNPKRNFFHGKASGHQLFQTALEVKEEYIAEHGLRKKGWYAGKRPEFWEIPSVGYWMVPHPESEDTPIYVFPEDDLLISLVDLYFTHSNPYLPLLHRPTFQQSLDRKEHLFDHHFGTTVMLVCALGACFSNDPRVFIDGNGSTTSAGWKWFSQVTVLRKTFFKRTSLYELQAYALSVMYTHSSHASDGVWTQVGMGLRLAMEVGAHRKRNTPDGRPTAENELWKRAFWVLVCLDRTMSLFHGRPYGIHEEDFDLDLPVDCDDEYWDKGFTQPLGKPSRISYFIHYIKLSDILATAMKTIYPLRRTLKIAGKTIDYSVREIIADLDSTMNNWMDSLPTHLRWNPNCKDDVLLRQSAALHAEYYDLQIFIHRPFIPSPRNPKPGAFPSLAICANAARLCFHVLECFNRPNAILLPHLLHTSVHAAIILLLNIWSGKKSGMAPNYQRDMEDVQRCMRLMKAAEQRWCLAGKYFDVVKELATAGDLSLNADAPSPGVVDSDYTDSSPNSSSTNNLSTPESIPSFENSPKGNTYEGIYSQVQGMNTLPVHTMELGSLPIYGESTLNVTPNCVVNTTSFPSHTPASQPFVPTTTDNSGTSQNLFMAADDFMKNSLFGVQTTYNNNNAFYFPPTSAPPGMDPGIVNAPPGFNEHEISLIFGTHATENTSLNTEGTSMSAADSIFAAYNMDWDDLNFGFEHQS